MKQLTILGIETSCDETAAAVYKTNQGILSTVLFSQIEQQKLFGGVVPEVASRTHVEKIQPIIAQALAAAQVSLDNIDAIAVTHKPGLPGSLLVGLNFAKAIAWSKRIPLVGVNHLEGHAFSSFIEHDVPFPHLCLTASGGHTSLYLVYDFGKYKTIGTTTDDAAGEAFDKIAKLIGLPYPGGPVIEQLAKEAEFKDFFHYPRTKKKSLDFSFSGLKTAVLYDLEKRGCYDIKNKTAIAITPEVQQKVASSLLVAMKDIFLEKLELACKTYPHITSVSFVGGVACNTYLREQLQRFCEEQGKKFYAPARKYCTDNAAMIAFVGHYKAQQGQFDSLELDIF